MAISHLGHTSEAAEHGVRAMELLHGDQFDLVLLDLMMPEMDGHQVLAQMKDDARLRDIPVIVISALDDMSSIVRCIEQGAEDYLSKDFDLTLFSARISASLEKKRLRDAVSSQLDFIRDALGKYVPEAVAINVIENQNLLQPLRTNATVMFTDIVGFTSITENMKPESVFAMLNEYFKTVIKPVTHWGGIVNQFQGDAMIVTFNVPLALEHHADCAVQAALDIQSATTEIKFGGIALQTRIGIHTGDVIAGNVGSGDRFNYTVYGDAVNLAARLEQLNKEYDTLVLVSADTVEQLTHEYKLSSIGEISIRGKEQKVYVHSITQT